MTEFQFPLIKVSLFFILGILVGHYFTPQPTIIFALLGFFLLVFSFAFYNSLRSELASNLFGLITLSLSLLIGSTTQVIHKNLYQKNHYYYQIGIKEKEHLLEISLKEKLKNSVYNDRFVATVQQFDNKKSSGKIILNIQKDSSNNHQLAIGSILKIKASIYKHKPIKNPNQFDYGKYLENQNIYAQAYCAQNNVRQAATFNKNIWYYTARFRNTIIRNLEKKGFHNTELSVIVALILGQQQDISPDIIQDYQYAGAIHILSVSGLHVGFILLFVGYLLKPFPNTPKWKFNKLLIVLLSLWLFGFIAGLAPSVLRSVVMFSFVATGRYLGRGVNIYNTLLVSALIILLFQPSFLFDVGFQLSYVSLYFIIWLQPLFANTWRPKLKITKFFWDIITVSFAAQIGAMGISIYYFHQFPGLFFITNIIILPAMGIILGLGVLVMLLAYFDVIPIFLMKILEFSIWILDKVIAWIASFEQFILQDISMNKPILITTYLMIFAIIIYLKKPKFNSLVLALFTIIIFQMSVFGSKYFYQNQQELVVFTEKNNTIITERMGQKAIIYSNRVEQNMLQNSNINQYLVGNFCSKHINKKIPKLLYLQNKKILIMDSIAIKPTDLKPDILIISHSPKINLERFLQHCKPKIIVADASNFKNYVKVWKTTCEKAGTNFHSTIEKGFYSIE